MVWCGLLTDCEDSASIGDCGSGQSAGADPGTEDPAPLAEHGGRVRQLCPGRAKTQQAAGRTERYRWADIPIFYGRDLWHVFNI